MKNKIVFLMMLMSVLASHCATAQTVIAVTENWPPIQVVKNKEVVSGLAVDIVQAVFNEANIDIRMKGLAWARAYSIALEQKNVMIFSMIRHPSREDKFKWIGDILHFKNLFWHLKTRKDIKVTTFNDLKKYRIGVPRSDIRHHYMLDKGFQAPQNLDVVASDAQTIKMLFRGRTDIILGNEMIVNHLLKSQGYNPSNVIKVEPLMINLGNLSMAFNLETPDALVNKVSLALKQIKDNGVYDKIFEQWTLKLSHSVDQQLIKKPNRLLKSTN